MKKVVVWVLALSFAFSLVACGEAGSDFSSEKQPEQASTEQNEPEQVDEKKEQKNEPHDTVVFTGSGDDIIDLDVTGYYYVFHITGNAEGNYFAVITYDGYGMYDDLLVNTTDPYSGKVKLGKDTTIVAVKASGDWSFTANK